MVTSIKEYEAYVGGNLVGTEKTATLAKEKAMKRLNVLKKKSPNKMHEASIFGHENSGRGWKPIGKWVYSNNKWVKEF